MGYTHYFPRRPTLPKRNFEDWAADALLIVESCGFPIFGPEGTNGPEINVNRVAFNGEASLDEDHEAFWIDRVYVPNCWDEKKKGRYFDFCKTDRKPYDLAVTACLIRMTHHQLDRACTVSSDGNSNDWAPGLALVVRLFGDGALPRDVRRVPAPPVAPVVAPTAASVFARPRPRARTVVD